MSFTKKGHHTGAALSSIALPEICIATRIHLHYIRPKHALNDRKDFVSFIDDLVNMIAPWEIVRYCNTEIFDISHTVKNFTTGSSV